MFEKEPETRSENALLEVVPLTDIPTWRELYDRIRVLAFRRSMSLLDDSFTSDDEFDRGARALRTLMGAAEIARRIKQGDEKDKASNEEDRKPPAFTDEEVRDVYRTISAQLDRIEDEQFERFEARQDAARAAGKKARSGGENSVGG